MIKLTKQDHFLWLVLDVKTAKAVFKNGTKAIYKLYPDDTESMVEFLEDIIEYDDVLYGIEIGFLDNIVKSAYN